MSMSYLEWAGELFATTPDIQQQYNLISSSIQEPTALFTEYFKHYEDVLLPRLSDGLQRLTDVISRLYGFPQSGITVVNGVSNGIFLVCRAFVEPGDEVLVESPGYEPFSAAARLAGAIVKPLPRRPPDYLIDPDEVASLITPKTRLIILSNLHNPSMTQLDYTHLYEIYTEAHKRYGGIKLLVDEIFHDFIRTKQDTLSRQDSYDLDVMTMNGMSKVYGMGAIHLGWLLAGPELSKRIRDVQISADGGGGTRVTAAIASLVLEHVEDYDRHWSSILQPNRQIMRTFIDPLIADGLVAGSVPANGCVMFPKLTRIRDAGEMREFLKLLNDKYRVYVVPGQFFQGPTHIRIGLGGNSDKLQAGMERLSAAIREYANSK